MLLFGLFIVLGIVFIAIYKYVDDNLNYDCELLTVPCCVISVLSFIVSLVMILVIVASNVGANGTLEAEKQRYESLTYQYENNLYDNDNDLGKKELYNQIQEWNENIARKKKLQNDPWIGWFCPDIYDDLDFIDYK